ncbi:hypothetical protein AAFC00_002737 [Neodothiora populina]|uniref:Major facilitator superfamily (MFS) profile domain-containing protein n=1 Tax=Neodothiora populina TaxID=2781224 RepID=A0ABR3P822_9PEZI
MGKLSGEVIYDGTNSPPESESQSVTVQDWTDEEEKRVVRKLDFTVLPLLTIVFFFLQLDRTNMGNALTDNFLKDTGITQYQYNIGQQLLSAGIVILEIPSNLILYKVGPRVWISCQILAWGLVATFQAFQHGLGPYIATRFLLGLCEAGFIPGGLYVLSMYYKKSETSKRFSVYFFGNNFAAACTGLMAYGILQMRGVGGLAGWQWLFLLEGIMTICSGLLFMALMPKDPNHPKSFLGFTAFTEREQYILRQRVLHDDASKERKHDHISMKELGHILSNWRIYPHVIMGICGMAPVTTLSQYGPTLVKSFGYGRLRSNALSSVGPWIQIVLNFLSGYLADKTNRRGFVNLGGLSLWWGFTLGNLILADSKSREARYALLTCALAVQYIWHPVNGAWLSMNSRSPAERSVTMAMFVMSANLGGIVGAQIFQAEDAPHYKTGWTVIVCLISVAIVMNLFNNVQYRLSNRALAKAEANDALDEKVEGQALPEAGWRYKL